MTRGRLRFICLLLAAMLSAGLVVFVTASPGGSRAKCFGKKATILGTKGDDTLNGTGNDDVIVGKDGDDEINGNGGKDRICGNSGEDEVFGDDGSDKVSGGRDDDTVEGNVGSDELHGGQGNDTVGSPDICNGNCQLHPNKVFGGNGFDTCYTGQLDRVRSCESTPNDDGGFGA